MENKLFVIKVGSNVIADPVTGLNNDRIAHLCDQISSLIKDGHQVVFVTSGAVAAGKMIRPNLTTNNRISRRQVYSAMGQVALLNIYNDIFAQQQIDIAQILVTRDDFTGREHYLNIRNCISGLLAEGILPVINENDTVSIEELMFTDNDELAGRIASMLGADELVLLTNVDGLMTGDPQEANSELVQEILPGDTRSLTYIQSIQSSQGRGGMQSKFKAAMKAATTGTSSWLANGTTHNILKDLPSGQLTGTHFIPDTERSQKRRWLAFEFPVEGAFIVNEGCKTALMTDGTATSLLAVGVVAIKENFNKGDVVKILDEQGNMIGYGMSSLSSVDALQNMGQKAIKPFIHYDYIYIENDTRS